MARTSVSTLHQGIRPEGLPIEAQTAEALECNAVMMHSIDDPRYGRLIKMPDHSASRVNRGLGRPQLTEEQQAARHEAARKETAAKRQAAEKEQLRQLAERAGVRLVPIADDSRGAAEITQHPACHVLEMHSVSPAFPPMIGDDFTELVDDIKAHGQLEPITVAADGRILDGRHRYLACEGLGIGVDALARQADADCE